MALETLSSGEMANIFVYDTISVTPYSCNGSTDTNILLEHAPKHEEFFGDSRSNVGYLVTPRCSSGGAETVERRKKRRRRPKVCKNKEEAETQRMTHITVERNRRKQMNEHLAVLRSLMPDSYVQRGDQASIVGGAIDFVKELEQVLQSLEAQKFLLLQEEGRRDDGIETSSTTTLPVSQGSRSSPFSQFLGQPQYYMSSCQNQNYKYYKNCRSSSKDNNNNGGGIAEIEVTMVETHANIRVLSSKRLQQLSKLVAAFHNMYLTILHLNVTTLDPLVLYSISTKYFIQTFAGDKDYRMQESALYMVEEGGQLNSADDIAGAVEHMLKIIEEEASPLPNYNNPHPPPHHHHHLGLPTNPMHI